MVQCDLPHTLITIKVLKYLNPQYHQILPNTYIPKIDHLSHRWATYGASQGPTQTIRGQRKCFLCCSTDALITVIYQTNMDRFCSLKWHTVQRKI